MPTIPTTFGVKVTMVYTYNSQRICNVYHVTNGGAATFAQLQALAVIFQTWENGYYKTIRNNLSLWVGCFTKALDAPGSPVWDLIPITFVAGTGGASGLPSFTTIAVRHTTGLSGRSYRGRTYLCAVPATQVTLIDQVLGTYVATVNAAFANLRTTLATGGWTFVVNSLYSGVDGSGHAIPRASGKMTPIVTSECGVALDTQRHRKLPGII